MQDLPEVRSLNRASSHSRLKRDTKQARFVATLAAAALFAAGCDAAQLQIPPPPTPISADQPAVTLAPLASVDEVSGEESTVAPEPLVESEPTETVTTPTTLSPDLTESPDTAPPATVPPTPPPTPAPTPAPTPTDPPTPASREAKELRFKPQIGTVALDLDDPPAIGFRSLETPGWDYFVSLDTPSRVEIKFAEEGTGQQGLFVATLKRGTVSATFKTDSSETVTLTPNSEVQTPKSTVPPVLTTPSG